MRTSTGFQSLTEDLQLKVLSHLDIHSLARCRVVCKCWDELIRSREFLTRFYKPEILPWVLVGLWNDLSASPLLWRPFSGCKPMPTSLPLGPPSFQGFRYSNGLIFGTTDMAGWRPRRTVVVANPLSNKWQQLQTPHDFVTISGKLDVATGGYMVQMLDGDGRTMEYSSASKTWSPGDPSSNVFAADGLEDWDYWGNLPEFGDGWPAVCGFERIVLQSRYKKREILATVVTNDEDDRAVGFGVLEWKAKQWILLGKVRTEDLMGEELAALTDKFKAYWEGHLLGDVILLNRDCSPAVAYHLVEERWECGPTPQDFPNVREEEELAQWEWDHISSVQCRYAFCPSFAASLAPMD